MCGMRGVQTNGKSKVEEINEHRRWDKNYFAREIIMF